MKLAFVISSLRGGGTERVTTTLANAWVQRGWSVALITLSSSGSDVYTLDPRIERISLDLIRDSAHLHERIHNNWRRVRALRKAILDAKPHVVLSFGTETNILAVLASYRTHIPVVVSERISLADHPPEHIWNWLFRGVYRRAAAIATLTARGAAVMEQRLGTRVHVIPNPVIVPESRHCKSRGEVLLKHPPTSFKLLAMGRLTSQKGFDLLLQAFACIAPEYPDWSLVILGEGEDRAYLGELARDLHVADRVTMPGFIEYPHDVMRAVDAFVLSSRYEGMPNALLEAMAVGLPCVSFDCRTGPGELIEHGTNGLLVPAADVAALANSLAQLFSDPALRTRLGANASKIAHRYSIGAIVDSWEKLLLSVKRGQMAEC